MAAFRHRFTLRQTRRTVPIMFSIELVQASDRRSYAGSFMRLKQHPVETLEDDRTAAASGNTLR